MSPRVFLITGTSTGFGNDYVQEVLDRGDIAVATARKPASLKFRGTSQKNFLACHLDVTDKKSIDDAFAKTLHQFGRVDVVVNNAGYGLGGCFEEFTDAQIRNQMDINFFGLLDVTRKAMSVMREQKPSGGVIQQITSIGGQVGIPCFSVYNASKWAVEGLTEAIDKEVKPEWGIKFTCIEPGSFRTDFAGRSMEFAERHPAYDHLKTQEYVTNHHHGKQPGDPKKAAKAMYELAIMQNPPLRAVLGSDAYKMVMAKLEAYDQNYKQYERLETSTDFDGYQAPE